ncbi:MAG TPA: cupin domain-containing protein [Spongiibacteraceae bacterium]|jgi:1,2-dihydroxy-3-keto-5-methylthiopentene dioxygenase|nr:cupin domain-containing protein [Spongiibacteraceae bacterium]HUH36308.1 cupin domain-containing protein [Spongiibacteraceae bacterium]
MSALTIFDEARPQTPLLTTTDAATIQARLDEVGVRFEQWQASQPVVAGDAPQTVLAAYQADIQRLVEAGGYQTVDVISIASDHPDKVALRQKFLSEHRHSEDEVRFFVAGRGLFALHLDDKVFEVLCEQGDLLSVPANTRHWFDLGANPELVAIRFFNNPDGWVAHYTGSAIADNFSRLAD